MLTVKVISDRDNLFPMFTKFLLPPDCLLSMKAKIQHHLTSKLYDFQPNVTTLWSKLTIIPVLIGSKFEVLGLVAVKSHSNWVSSDTPKAHMSLLLSLQPTTLLYLTEWWVALYIHRTIEIFVLFIVIVNKAVDSNIYLSMQINKYQHEL